MNEYVNGSCDSPATTTPPTKPTEAAPDMRSLVGLVRKDLAATSNHARRRGISSKTHASHSHHRQQPPPPPSSVGVDPSMAKQLRDLLAALERAPQDRRLAVNGLSVLRYYAAHEPAAHALLLQPEALRALWDAAQLHALDGAGGSDAVLESFLAVLLCLTEHHADRACVRGSLPAYAPFLVGRLRGRMDRGSSGARALEVLVRRLGVGSSGHA